MFRFIITQLYEVVAEINTWIKTIYSNIHNIKLSDSTKCNEILQLQNNIDILIVIINSCNIFVTINHLLQNWGDFIENEFIFIEQSLQSANQFNLWFKFIIFILSSDFKQLFQLLGVGCFFLSVCTQCRS